MSETLDSFVVSFGESADAAPLGDEEKNFNAVFEPLRNKLNASISNTRPAENLPKRVTAAETRADAAASDAKSASIGQHWNVAFEQLDEFKTAMGKLDEVYIRSADDLARRMDLRIAKLTLRHQELKATGLTQAAGDTEAKLTAAVEARTTANAGATPEVRLVALQKAYGDALLAHLEADDALAAKSNDGAARGLSDIRQGMADVIATLADAVPNVVPTKADLQARLAEWDKKKAANDKEARPGVKRSGFKDLDREAAQIIAEARNVARNLNSSAAMQKANESGNKAAGDKATKDACEIARRQATLASVRDTMLAALKMLPDGPKTQWKSSVDDWIRAADEMDHAHEIDEENTAAASGDHEGLTFIESMMSAAETLIGDIEAAANDARGVAVDEKKAAAMQKANQAGNLAAEDAREIARRQAMLASIRDTMLAGFEALPDGPKARLQERVDEWVKLANEEDHVKGIADERADTEDGDDQGIPMLQTLIYSAGKYLEEIEAATAAVKEQQAYEKAIKSRFGIKIEVPPGMTNTHFERFYEVMERLPIEHVTIDSLKELKYNKDKAWDSAAYYQNNQVVMGNFSDDESIAYTDPATGKLSLDPESGEPVEANSFSISSLHEIGHAVDHQYKIMINYKTDSGCGAWEYVNDMLTALVGGAKAAAPKLAMNDDTLKGLLDKAMNKGKPDEVVANSAKIAALDESDKPDQLQPDEWQKIKPFLDKVVSMREGNKPWDQKTNQLLIGSKAYHEAYPGDWYSYDPAARKSQVRGYQFRAPGEWFADLYAWSWYFKGAPPATIPKDVAKYLYSKRA